MTSPRPVNAWWWLLPPVAYWKRHRQQEAFRQAALAHLPASEVQQLLAFSNAARGWFTVAVGATLIATKETWELGEILGWPQAVTWGIVGAALIASIGNAASTAGRTAKVLEAAGDTDASASRSA